MVKIEKIEMIYSPGTTRNLEDGHFINSPFFGVVDGYSAPYSDERPPVLFGGLTGGQMVKSVILDAFNSGSADLSLERVAFEANGQIGRQQGYIAQIPLNQADRLAGASFLFAKIKEENVEILQGGDCYGLWVKESGKIGITQNKFYPYELELRNKIVQLMQDCQQDRQEMWKRFCPFLSQMRKENINTKYVILNGQPKASKIWEKIEIPLFDLKYLICFSDGLVPFKEAKNQQQLAEKVVKLFNEGGFDKVLNWTRTIEKEEAAQSHEDQAEATGLAIRFR